MVAAKGSAAKSKLRVKEKRDGETKGEVSSQWTADSFDSFGNQEGSTFEDFEDTK